MKVYRIIDMRRVIQPGYARRWTQPPKAAANFRASAKMWAEAGYARRWIKRNWARALYAGAWITAGIIIREAVAATRPEHWVIGSEIIPAVLCWTIGIRCALGETSPRKRGARR